MKHNEKHYIDHEKLIALAEKIKHTRKSLGLGVNQFCVKMDIDPAWISRLENTRIKKINPLMLKEVATKLGLNYMELFNLVGYIDEREFEVYKQGSNLYSTEIVSFPIYGKVSAGHGYLNFECEENSLEIINNDYFGKNVFAMDVKGDSMEPEIPENSSVLVDPDQCDFKSLHNKIVVLRYNDEIYVKKLICDNENFILKSFNQNYKDIFILKNNLNELECLGKVVRVIFEKKY